jgi:hypothetical protein
MTPAITPAITPAAASPALRSRSSTLEAHSGVSPSSPRRAPTVPPLPQGVSLTTVPNSGVDFVALVFGEATPGVDAARGRVKVRSAPGCCLSNDTMCQGGGYPWHLLREPMVSGGGGGGGGSTG